MIRPTRAVDVERRMDTCPARSSVPRRRPSSSEGAACGRPPSRDRQQGRRARCSVRLRRGFRKPRRRRHATHAAYKRRQLARACIGNASLSSRSSEGYPRDEGSGMTTRRAPARSASPVRHKDRRALPAQIAQHLIQLRDRDLHRGSWCTEGASREILACGVKGETGSRAIRRRIAREPGSPYGHAKISQSCFSAPTPPMQIAIAQLNRVVGDIAANFAPSSRGRRGRRAGADARRHARASLCGYPPEDLLLRAAFLATARRAGRARGADRGTPVDRRFSRARRPAGATTRRRAPRRPRRAVSRKQRLPNYTVFDEKRYFDAGQRAVRRRDRRRALRPASSARTSGNPGRRRRRRRPARR